MRASTLLAALISLLIPCTSAVAGEAQAPYEESIQYALERLTSGISANSQIGDVEVTVKPTRTWKSVSGYYCRQYEITIAKPGSAPNQDVPSQGEGIRCRDGDGIWKRVK
jgi:surface antigen